ncbi:MAG: glycosyltransferase [Microcella sp.]|uniref:glycosyltransferase family 2 protein n=1 Tax=Microcella sp. TaxID=1913979 RepID=UPI00331576EA
MPRVAAVIPTLGTNVARLAAAVEAVQAQRGDVELEVIVVLNGAPLPEAAGLDARTRVLTTGINLGWGGGLHVGRAATDAEFLWLVQDDSYPQEHCLRELVAALDASPAQALVSPIVVRTERENDASPTVPYARRASWGGVLGSDGAMDHWEPRRDIPIDEIDAIPDLDYVPSRGMLVRTSVWDEVGGTDLRAFPVGWVDVLLCSAVRAAGHTIGLAPTARIRHDRSASTPTILNGYVRERGPRLLREAGAPPLGASDDVPEHVLSGTLSSATASVLELAEFAERTTVPRSQHEAIAQKLETASRERDRAQRELEALRGSLSWRVTAPLRRLRGLARRRS